MSLFKSKEEQGCGTCRFFWYHRISGSHNSDRGKCCYMPDPQPTKLVSDWCGQWQEEKHPEEGLKEALSG